MFSPAVAGSLRTIRYCAIALIAFVAGAEVIIIFLVESDDRAGGIAIGVLITLASAIVAITMAVLERSTRAS